MARKIKTIYQREYTGRRKEKEVFEKIYRMCEKKGDTLTEEELDKVLEEL